MGDCWYRSLNKLPLLRFQHAKQPEHEVQSLILMLMRSDLLNPCLKTMAGLTVYVKQRRYPRREISVIYLMSSGSKEQRAKSVLCINIGRPRLNKKSDHSRPIFHDDQGLGLKQGVGNNNVLGQLLDCV